MEYEAEEVISHFDCDECNAKEHCSVSEAIYNGPPMCPECNVEMEISHIIVEDKEK